MNIFYLDEDAKTSAEMHLDKHCSKMLVEYAQLMSTAHRVLDGTEYYDKNKIGSKIKRWTHEKMHYIKHHMLIIQAMCGFEKV